MELHKYILGFWRWHSYIKITTENMFLKLSTNKRFSSKCCPNVRRINNNKTILGRTDTDIISNIINIRTNISRTFVRNLFWADGQNRCFHLSFCVCWHLYIFLLLHDPSLKTFWQCWNKAFYKRTTDFKTTITIFLWTNNRSNSCINTYFPILFILFDNYHERRQRGAGGDNAWEQFAFQN